MKTLLIILVFMISMTTGCSKDSSDSAGTNTDGTATTNGEFSDLNSDPLTENMTNDNKSFSSPRGR